MKCQGIGIPSLRYLVVGEAPGETEEKKGFGLVGASGDLFVQLLVEAGLLPPSRLGEVKSGRYSFGDMIFSGSLSSWGVTNVVQYRPPGNNIDLFFPNKTQGKKLKSPSVRGKFVTQEVVEGFAELRAFIRETTPELIFALGNTALWALTGNGGDATNSPSGITSWRGSQLYLDGEFHAPIPVLPLFHPAAIMRKWDWKFITVHDLRTRTACLTPAGRWNEPDYKFHIRPSLREAHDWLSHIEAKAKSGTPIAVDLETTRRRFITNIGFATSSTEAFNIPFMCHTDPAGYWTVKEETELRWRIRQFLQARWIKIVGQNYDYDRLYIAREFLCRPVVHHDTMTRHHTLFPLLPKPLEYLSSLYCEYHRYWKDDNKEGNERLDDDMNWTYNCQDAVVTWEVDQVLDEALKQMSLEPQAEFQMKLHDLVFPLHQTGVKIDLRLREELQNRTIEEMLEREYWLEKAVGKNVDSKSPKPWHRSSQQIMALFYKVFNIPPVFSKKKPPRPTADDDALKALWDREPLVRPLVRRLAELRSLRVMKSNVLDAKLVGGRMLPNYIVPGTGTFRFASQKNGYDEGTNVQNITEGG